MKRFAYLDYELQTVLEEKFGTKAVEGYLYKVIDDNSEKLIDQINRVLAANYPKEDPVKLRIKAEKLLDDNLINIIAEKVLINPDIDMKNSIRSLAKELNSLPKQTVPFAEQEDNIEVENIIKKHLNPNTIIVVAREIIDDHGSYLGRRVSSIASAHNLNEKIRLIAIKISSS